MEKSGLTFRYLKSDLPAGLVVFLVALPLCLGIALASGAPLFAGIITGIVGGMVVGMLNKSELSVSGPAAGLTVIVLNAIMTLGSYEAFLLSVVLAGILQMVFGFAKAGIIGNFFPSSVIRGMLAAIGLILILGQLPVFLGLDTAGLKDEGLSLLGALRTGETGLLLNHLNLSALVIGLLSLGIMIAWEHAAFSRRGVFRFIPAALLAVLFAIGGNLVAASFFPAQAMGASYLVNIPGWAGGELQSAFLLPDFRQWNNPQVYTTAITIAIIASLETLLSVEAVDKMDPLKRESPRNQVLKTQGLGNLICGLTGGLPMTAVIVRSATNVAAGGKTRMASVIHGGFLILSVLALSSVLNLIPLSALSAILLVVGFKLTRPALYKMQYKLGKAQFVPFIVTVGTILVTDLLVGIITGIAVSVYFVLKNNYKLSHSLNHEDQAEQKVVSIHLSEHVSFLNKPVLLHTLEQVPPRSRLVIDGSRSRFIDHDALEIIHGFKRKASARSILLELNKVPHMEHSDNLH